MIDVCFMGVKMPINYITTICIGRKYCDRGNGAGGLSFAYRAVFYRWLGALFGYWEACGRGYDDAYLTMTVACIVMVP